MQSPFGDDSISIVPGENCASISRRQAFFFDSARGAEEHMTLPGQVMDDDSGDNSTAMKTKHGPIRTHSEHRGSFARPTTSGIGDVPKDRKPKAQSSEPVRHIDDEQRTPSKSIFRTSQFLPTRVRHVHIPHVETREPQFAPNPNFAATWRTADAHMPEDITNPNFGVQQRVPSSKVRATDTQDRSSEVATATRRASMPGVEIDYDSEIESVTSSSDSDWKLDPVRAAAAASAAASGPQAAAVEKKRNRKGQSGTAGRTSEQNVRARRFSFAGFVSALKTLSEPTPPPEVPVRGGRSFQQYRVEALQHDYKVHQGLKEGGLM